MSNFVFRLLSSILLLNCASPIWAQTDLAISTFGAFNQSTAGSFITQKPSNQTGILIEARHIRNPLVGYEVTCAYNRANQAYVNGAPASPLPCPSSGCTVLSSAAVSANAHEFSADWIASLKILNLRPFALAGGGVLINAPTKGTVLSTTDTCNILGACVTNASSTPTPTQTQAKATFVYGAGVDWTVLPHLGLRFQYRGRVSKAPDLQTVFSSTNSFTHTSEPSIGAFYRF